MAKSIFKITVIQYWVRDCWIGPDGKPCDREAPGARFVKARKVPKGTPGAKKVKKKSSKWYGRTPGEGKAVPLSTNKTAAQLMLAELANKAEMGKVGVRDPFEAHRKRPLAEHLEDYRRFLEAEGNCAEYVAKTYARIKAVLDGCGFMVADDLGPEKVAEFLHGLRRDPVRPTLLVGQEWFKPRELMAALAGTRPPQLARILRREGLEAVGAGKKRRYPRATVEALQGLLCRGVGVSTSNGYLTAVKGLSRWLFEKERVDRDRLVSLSRLNAKTDRRHERRALPEKELQALLSAAGGSEVEFLGLTGNDRMMVYALAMTTGFRASELASLSPRSFDLEAASPTATVKAAYSKNRREAVQPLPPDVTEALRSYLPSRPADRSLWPGGWHKDAAEMLRIDLAAAGLPYRDADGRVADFHALRHSYITLLERSGVSPKLAQELARHSDIRLTMNVYTHARLHDLAGAVDGLPALLPSTAEPPVRATGTDSVCAPVCTGFAQTADSECNRLRLAEARKDVGRRKDAGRNLLIPQGVETGCDSVRRVEGKLPGQDSNLDKENQNLLCYRYTTG